MALYKFRIIIIIIIIVIFLRELPTLDYLHLKPLQ